MDITEEKGKSKLVSKKRTTKIVNRQPNFDPICVEIKSFDTVIHLLTSKESDVLLQAVAAVDRQVCKSPDYLKLLCEPGAVAALLHLARSPDTNTSRFSLKLLSQLSHLEAAQRLLMADKALLSFFVHILSEDEDVVAHEFSSLILAELTANDPHARESLLCVNHLLLGILFLRITSADPDVQKNCAQLMANLLHDPGAQEAFTGSQHFSFEPLLSLLRSQYPVIQHLAATVMESLTRHTKQARAHALFRQAHGIECLLDVLETAEWKDLHQEVLHILINCAQDPDTAQYIYRSGGLQRLVVFIDTDNSTRSGVLSIIANIAGTECGREALHENNIPEQLVRLLRENHGGVAAACLGIALLTRHRASLNTLVGLTPVTDLVAVLRTSSQFWEVHSSAAHALCELIRLDRGMALQLLENSKREIIVNLLSIKIPEDLSIKLIHCLTNAAVHEDIRSAIADNETIEVLLSYLEDDGEGRSTGLAVAAMECLSVFVSEAQVRDWLLLSGGIPRIVHCLRHHNVPMAHAAASLLQLLATDSHVAANFIRAGALQLMMERVEMRTVMPVWTTAMDVLLDSHLPTKLAYRHRLEVTDLTQEGFYVPRRPEKKFLMLEELLAECASPIRPIYVCNFENSAAPLPPIEQTTAKNAGRKIRNQRNAGSNDSSDFCVCLPDPYLPRYLEQLQRMLAVSKLPQTTTMQRIREKTMVVAQFIVDQMSGRDPDEACDTHQLELHLYQLKVFLQRNIIPLGYLRVGLHLERAVLFKVLADRLGLPCALVRGPYGRSWVEIPLPQQADAGCEDGLSAIPMRLLRPNHIVDLMDNVGQLLPLHSYEADIYIGKPVH